MRIQRKLKVYPLWREDVFKDIARLPEADRGSIREGSLCTVSTNDHSKQLIVRGLEETLSGGIMLDEITRKLMGGIETGFSYDFTIKEAGIYGHIKWACTVADRGARISAWIGIASVVLGILGAVLGAIGAVLGAIGLWIAIHPPH